MSSGGGRIISMFERAKLVCWFEETHSLAMTARRYRAQFGVEPPKMEHIKKWHSQFMNTGSIASSSSRDTSPFSSSQTTSSQSLAQTLSSSSFQQQSKNILEF